MAALIKSLIDAGGLVISVGLLLGFSWLLITARVVPGYIYQKEVVRGDRATEIGEKAVDVSDKAVDGLTALTAQQAAMAKLLEGYIAGSRKP